MKKLFFLTNTVDLANPSDGLAKKINAQVKAFEHNGYVTELSGCSNTEYIIHGQKFFLTEEGIFKKTKEMLQSVERYLSTQSEYEILYIRKFYFTPYFLSFLKKIRPKFKYIILELPTYPYYGELLTLRAKVGFWIENLLVTKSLRKYIDKIVTFSSDKKIYGIDCIKISNGIDASEQIYFEEPSRDVIHFISVSSISFWHGIDRFILALKDHGEDNVHFHVVGGDNEVSLSLQSMVSEYSLKDKVTFHGHKSGDDLKAIYAMSHIGVGSLGRHRSNIYYLNSLKNREYIAKGLPIIYSEIDDDLEETAFVYKLPASEELIDLSKVIEWFSESNFDRQSTVKFSDKFLWKSQMEILLSNLE
ncbi:glycosyltransferase [Acinetobacter pittii]|jgi:glycosyltransferase involved in cell wall biosynthesis|uniref:glycosyltransferase n=1 Tax=Acinetobacter pittii TaxID=48296 RepID=UPI0005CB5F18|nr:glycosyltransferase [Acinetobacter pittii]MCG9496612.1 glycosyltransferase [Acinetobacter pittii]